jgi:hypothetical protein
MSKHKKHVSPSQIRYDQNHPTVSYRVTKELKERLKALKEIDGKSIAQILKIGAGLLEVKASSDQELSDQGYKMGFQKARGLYQVSYFCSNCGKLIVLKTPEEKKAAASYMKEAGWSHKDCSQP